MGAPVRFVGRADELATLGSVLARADADDRARARRRGAVVTIVGEPGAGKTALAEAATAGRRTVWARAREGGGAPPMWLWEQVLGQLGEPLAEPLTELIERSQPLGGHAPGRDRRRPLPALRRRRPPPGRGCTTPIRP